MNEGGKFSGSAIPASHGIPVIIPDAELLNVRLAELRSIYQRMTITDRDRATDAFRGMDSLAAPSTEFHDHDSYVEQWYLGDAARDAFLKALCRGEIPIWTDHHGQRLPLDPSVLFAPNKWERRPVEAGIYRPMNLRNDHGDDRRAASAEARLWIMNVDWPPVRDALIAERERCFGSELPIEWRTLLQPFNHRDRGSGEQDVASADFGHQWTLHEAVAWITTEDDAVVDQQQAAWSSYAEQPRLAGSAVWLRLENKVARTELDRARELLRAACEARLVAASGVPASRGSRQRIPAADFISVELWPGHGGQLHRIVGGKSEPARWLDLRFDVEDVRSLTIKAGATEPTEPMAPTDRSGGPGAPSSMHLIERHMRDRHEAGLLLPTLVEEATALSSWFADQPSHAGLRPATAKTIKNRLRGLYRELSGRPGII